MEQLDRFCKKSFSFGVKFRALRIQVGTRCLQRAGYQALSLPSDRAPMAMDIVFGEADPP